MFKLINYQNRFKMFNSFNYIRDKRYFYKYKSQKKIANFNLYK